MNTYLLYVKATLAALLSAPLLWALPACSDNKGEEVLPQEEERLYTVTLSLNPSSRGATTKANPDWAVDTEDEVLEAFERHIKDCVVAIFRNGNWVQSLSTGVSGGTSDDITINNDNPTHEGNSTKVGTASIELPAGTYTFYAFANLTSLNIDEGTAGTTLINELVTGQTSTGSTLTENALKEKAVSLGNDPNRFNPDANIYIPMSSYGETTALDSDASLEITLFRMLGKVTIQIDNQTQEELKLNSISMGNFRRDGDILLVPYTRGEITLDDLTQNEEGYGPLFPEDGKKTSSFAHEIKFSPADEITAGSKSERYTFYEFETGSSSQGTDGDMWVQLNINGKDDSQKSLAFSFMRRNDWLNIPVMVAPTELTISFKELDIPIGGAPETVTTPAGEPFFPSINYTLKKPGELRIDFKLDITGFDNIKLDYEPGSHVANLRYTEAVVTENVNDLLYDADEQAGLKNNTELTITQVGDASGYIMVTTQELAYLGTATIELTLVATYTKDGTPGRMTIPYTITLTNGKPAKEGGN